MVTKDVSLPGAPFEIARIWIDDDRLFYTRRGDSLVYTGPARPGVKAFVAALGGNSKGFEVGRVQNHAWGAATKAYKGLSTSSTHSPSPTQKQPVLISRRQE